MTPTPTTDLTWLGVPWLVLSDMAPLSALVMLSVVLLAMRGVGRLQDHFELKMILREAPPSTVVSREARGNTGVPKLVVRVGETRSD